MSRSFHSGRHESGQNFLIDPAIIQRLCRLGQASSGTVLEVGAGAGALSHGLARGQQPLIVVENDANWVQKLRVELPKRVQVVHADVLKYHIPETVEVILGNIPFHLSTAILRKLLRAKHWHKAVLLTQWEFARRRAAVGGASMLTAQVWPWFDFSLDVKVPARAFKPKPSVDGGIVVVQRRRSPLVPEMLRPAYRDFVHRGFTAPGRGMKQICTRTWRVPKVDGVLDRNGISPAALPRDLNAEQWAALFKAVQIKAAQGRSPLSGP